MPEATRLLAQLRAVLELTNTEIQIAETRVVQARTEAVRREFREALPLSRFGSESRHHSRAASEMPLGRGAVDILPDTSLWLAGGSQ